MAPGPLDYITIKGFKSIASIEKLRLGPINVLIGANGSGKSNFIGAFALLHAVLDGRLQQYVTAAGGAEKVLHFGSKTTREMQLSVSFKGDGSQYDLRLSPASGDGLFPSEEWVVFREGYRPESGDERNGGIPQWARLYLASWRIYHLDDASESSLMRKTAKVDDNRFLRADGSNLAAFLYLLHEKYVDSYDLIRRTVQRVAPFFDDFRLQPRQLKPDDIQLEWRHQESDQYFDASSLSDGTLRFIGLATLFLQPEEFRPSVIIVDEPELGLHPYAIEMLAALIRQAAVKTQVIVATQSSLLLDHFKPEEVLVANRVDGGTQITPLDPERLGAWLEDYSLGQLWEKNELGARPIPD